ncbi:hypothetical protein JCM19236_3289 [Vibrio sp. JCM 19236]|nr:hypothetical protein JCM19236_3289 [Vibrio sp. JCM 19236]
MSSNLDGSYVFEKAEPAWANPQDGKFQEYADFNFNDGKWDDLTSYWDYYRKEVQSNGDASELGKRSVLDEERNVMLVVDNDPQNTLFQEWRAESTQISDEKWTKFVQWEHYPLTDYPFTADSLNIGQAYRIYQKQSNGLWIATSFDEWGSQDVDLRLEIENAINGGAALEDIDSELVPGLNRYGKKLPTETFRYDQSGQPVQWYLATDDQRFTEGGDPLMLPVTLENGAYCRALFLDLMMLM